MYVLSWRTVSALTRVLFCCLFSSLIDNSGNKHQNNTIVSTETVCHLSTYFILYMFYIISVSFLQNPTGSRTYVCIFGNWLGMYRLKQMVAEILVNTGSGNGFLYDGT